MSSLYCDWRLNLTDINQNLTLLKTFQTLTIVGESLATGSGMSPIPDEEMYSIWPGFLLRFSTFQSPVEP